MEPLTILRADPLDLLFENRNKAYGAYPLRKYYAQRLMISLGIVISCLFILVFFYFRFRNAGVIRYIPDCPVVILEPFNPITQPKPVDPPLKPAATKPSSTLTYETPVIARDPPPGSVMANIAELNTHAIGLQTAAGEGSTDQEPFRGDLPGTIAKTLDSTENSPEILDHAEQMPEFPGGPEALKRFLQKNLQMPENNLETGTQVKVTARFVVDQDGKVRNVEIIQSADDVFNREVTRVILKMPVWKPGKQHNRNVAVYFSLPVNFLAEE